MRWKQEMKQQMKKWMEQQPEICCNSNLKLSFALVCPLSHEMNVLTLRKLQKKNNHNNYISIICKKLRWRGYLDVTNREVLFNLYYISISPCILYDSEYGQKWVIFVVYHSFNYLYAPKSPLCDYHILATLLLCLLLVTQN